MKKTAFIFITFLTGSAFGQSLTPTVVGSCGDYFVGSNGTLSWTLGEIMTETYTGSNNQLTQGFHQPIRVTGNVEEIENSVLVNLYPNPVQAELSITIPGNTETITVSLYDASGRLVLTELYTGSGTQQINMQELSNGLYILKLTGSDNKIIDTFKIQKSK